MKNVQKKMIQGHTRTHINTHVNNKKKLLQNIFHL